MRLTILLTIYVLLIQTISAQEIVSVTYLNTFSKGILATVSPYPDYSVKRYKVTYTSNDINGDLDTLSGLLSIPIAENTRFPLCVYQHGTVVSKTDVPSNSNTESTLAVVLAGAGYVVLAPDYVGLGDGRGFHPYLHVDSQSWAAVDMINAVKGSTNLKDTFMINEQLYITGYSQGGHAAMGLHKTIQEKHSDSLAVTESAPMSGPYFLSGSMVPLLLSDQEYSQLSYVPYVMLGMLEAYPELKPDYPIEAIFKPAFISDISQFYENEITRSDLNIRLKGTLNEMGQTNLPKLLLQDSIVSQFTQNPDFVLLDRLKQNDLNTWVPDSLVHIIYCKADDQVIYTNSTTTRDTMVSLGAQNITIDDVDSTADHTTCVQPAVTKTLEYFRISQQIDNLTSVTKINFSEFGVVFPNPVSKTLKIKLTTKEPVNLKVYNIIGQLVAKEKFQFQKTLNTSNWQNGVYILQLESTDSFSQTKIIKH